ncbi:MAG: peptide deformylase [Cytophagales bacterium]
MIYPIVAYGDPVLKKRARDINKDELNLKQLVADMYETMYQAKGVGLAGPQIGKNLRIFVIDGEPMEEDELIGFKQAFINPEIEDEFGDDWTFEEGCLSIPNIRENVDRPEMLKIKYYDENWNFHEEEYEGLKARIIQHEYDHIEGILFTDHLSGFKKRILKGKLNNISKGKVEVDYKMRFPAR